MNWIMREVLMSKRVRIFYSFGGRKGKDVVIYDPKDEDAVAIVKEMGALRPEERSAFAFKKAAQQMPELRNSPLVGFLETHLHIEAEN